MSHDMIFWIGTVVLVLTMTGGMWMFLENKPLASAAAKKVAGDTTSKAAGHEARVS